jgi:hypothetical protein
MQLDYADAFKAIIDAPPEKIIYYSKLYDEKFKSIRDLYENGGISERSWKTLISRECPKLRDENFSFGSAKLGSAKEICDASKAFWEGNNANANKSGSSGSGYCFLCPSHGPGVKR